MYVRQLVHAHTTDVSSRLAKLVYYYGILLIRNNFIIVTFEL